MACMMCHGLKDRHPLDRWPLALLALAAVELGHRGITFDGTQREWPDQWDDLSSHARVLWAKCAAIAMDKRQHSRARHVDSDLDLIAEAVTK